MGWAYGIHSLDPQVIRETTSLSKAELAKRLQGRGVPPEDLGSDNWDEFDENQALSVLATTREWDLDRSLLDLTAVADLYAALQPVSRMLKEMEDFEASALASGFHSVEAGLMGIAMPATIAAAFGAGRAFVGEAGRKRFAGTSLPLVRRVFSAGLRKRLLTENYLWDNWTRLVEATEWASQRQEWLGLHMA